MITGEHRQALRITFVALYKTFLFIRSGFCFRQLTCLLYTNPWLLFICSIEIFFLDFAAGLASLGSSHVTGVKRLPRSKTPDGPKHDEVTCTQACLKHVYLHRQRLTTIHNCWVSGLHPPAIKARSDRPALVQRQGASGLPPVLETRPSHPETFGGWKDLPSQLPQVRALLTAWGRLTFKHVPTAACS